VTPYPLTHPPAALTPMTLPMSAPASYLGARSNPLAVTALVRRSPEASTSTLATSANSFASRASTGSALTPRPARRERTSLEGGPPGFDSLLSL